MNSFFFRNSVQKIAQMKVIDLEKVSQFSWYVQRILKSLVLVQSICGDMRYGFVACWCGSH